ncbi:riboflavin biosynthesis protein RibF [Sesbania bispinosa]|nr:riboflavin biosynthesis protein RibF [Sesbania bispinosa]
MAIKDSVWNMKQVASWDNIFRKEFRVCLKAEVLTFKKDAKSIFNMDNSIWYSSLRRILRLCLNIDVTTIIEYVPSLVYAPMQHFLAYLSKTYL